MSMDGDGTNFMAEIGMAAFSFPPKGWAFCNGQLLPINQNQALFSLLGTNYGGDGRVNFGLPDLRGRVPIHMGNGFTLGERGGEEAHTIILSELPTHTHFALASSATAGAVIPTSSHVVAQGAFETYRAPSALAAMDPGTIATVGGSQPHLNMQPYLVLNFCIALQGVFPSQN